jgi:hypothetical protein
MSETRSIHVQFTDEQWAELAHEAVRRRLPRGKTVAQLAVLKLAELRRNEASGDPTRLADFTLGDGVNGEVKHG